VATTGKVLVADDDPDLLRAYARVLLSAGHQVTAAPNGAAAIEHFRQQPFDVVVSDVAMPGMDGLQLLRAIREHDLDVPVLLITAGPSLETAVQALEHGAFRYLQKPVPFDVLVGLVGNAIALSRVAKLKRQVLEESGALARQIGDRAGLQVKFQAALEKLWMAYQPIVHWSRRRTYAHEALVRSNEPTLPHPGALFDAAERLGEVITLGRTIRQRTVGPMAQTDLLLFVNLSTPELEDEELYSVSSPLAPLASRTVLEITERASLDAINDVRGRVAALRRMGFRIALDDIGAGYAGLSSFAALEPDVVKLDMSLVRDVHIRDQAAARAVHDLALRGHEHRRHRRRRGVCRRAEGAARSRVRLFPGVPVRPAGDAVPGRELVVCRMRTGWMS
jgi:EAL domain-containing protein (putative c-di-GMP-specific phosphodiesterase class I)/ActR/RegA family two-component response regulator